MTQPLCQGGDDYALVETEDVASVTRLDPAVELINLLLTPEHGQEINLGIVVQDGGLVGRPGVDAASSNIKNTWDQK